MAPTLWGPYCAYMNMTTFPNQIPGLLHIPDFLTPNEEAELIKLIDENHAPWLTDLKRRVQHFGYIYSYRSNRPPEYIGPLPYWLNSLAIRLHILGLMSNIADQAIINEYFPGQNISAHIDSRYFGPEIATLSLNSTCVTRFRKESTGEKVDKFLERCSLLVLAGEARKSWTHEIPKRKSDEWAGMRCLRGRRLSVTLRTVLVG